MLPKRIRLKIVCNPHSDIRSLWTNDPAERTDRAGVIHSHTRSFADDFRTARRHANCDVIPSQLLLVRDTPRRHPNEIISGVELAADISGAQNWKVVVPRVRAYLRFVECYAADEMAEF